MPRRVPGPYGRNKKIENIMLLLKNSTPSKEKRQKDEKTLNRDEYKNQVIDNVIKLFFCCCLVTKSCLSLLWPCDLWPAHFSVHGISQARILECVATSFSRGSSSPGIKPTSPHWQADSLTLSHQGNLIKLYLIHYLSKAMQWSFGGRLN